MSKFKVGDRVRLTRDNEGFGRKGAAGKVVRVDEFPRVLFDNGNEVWVDADSLEKVEAGLRIEAGKFYKTRDGRKVGPMEPNGVDNWPFIGAVAGESRAYFNANGTCPYLEEYDLIAEWVDPEAVPVVADEPKFKVGDRVTVSGYDSIWDGDGVITSIEDTFACVDFGREGFYDEGGFDFRYIKHSSPNPTTPAIVCLIRNGQPVPATKPHVHADRASAEKEAERLARKAPGSEFGVYELVGRRVADVTVRSL